MTVNNLMTHAERKAAVRAEVAQEMLGSIIAHYAAEIAQEHAKLEPDADLVAKAEAEQRRVALQRDAMDINDRDQVEALIAEYGPIVRKLYA